MIFEKKNDYFIKFSIIFCFISYLNEENLLKKKEVEVMREDPMDKWYKNAAKKPKIQPPSKFTLKKLLF